MAEDNTPLIAAISAEPLRRKRLEKFVERLLSEEYDSKAMDAVFPEASGRGLPTDSAIFYYPGIDEGIFVFGPISVQDMLDQFFKETLPGILPETAEFKKLPSRKLADRALSAGMVVLFGEGGRLNQVMAKSSRVRLPDGGSSAEDVFDSAEERLVYMPAPGTVDSSTIPIGEIVPQLKWLASAK